MIYAEVRLILDPDSGTYSFPQYPDASTGLNRYDPNEENNVNEKDDSGPPFRRAARNMF